MSRLFEFPFSVASDELAKAREQEYIVLPRIYSTVVSGLCLDWQLRIYPHGVKYSNSIISEKFNVCLTLLTPAELKADTNFAAHIALQIVDKDGHFPAVADNNLTRVVGWASGNVCLTVNVKPDLSPGKHVVGRFLVCINSAAVSPAALAQAKVGAVKTVDYGPITARLYEEGITNNAAFCDTILACRDGHLRANSGVLFVESDYFFGLFNFKETAGAPVGERMADLTEYPVATVAAIMKLLHTFSLPPLGDFSVADLNLLLHLGSQVAPKGLELLKARVEQTLLGRNAANAAELGLLAALGETHGLSLLANKTLAGIAAQSIRHHKEIQEIVQEKVWESVENLCDNRIEGIYYFVTAPAPTA